MNAKLMEKIISNISYTTGPSQQILPWLGGYAEWECFLHGQDDSFYKNNF